MSDICYVTLGQEASSEFEEKKSVFIGHAKHIDSEEDALTFIKSKQKKYYDATHNVWGYILSGGSVARFSDDGEPGGTAGVPVLETMKKSGIDDAVVVVTRYFGGTLLGAGGLIRAYSHSAKLAIEASGIVKYEELSVFSLNCSYSDYQKLLSELPKLNATIENTDFSDSVSMTFSVRTAEAEELKKRLTEISGGKLAPIFLETKLGAVNI